MPDAQRGRHRHRPEHVSRIEMPDDQPIADVRPRRLAHELDVEALGRGEALLHRRDDRRAVEQRNEIRR